VGPGDPPLPDYFWLVVNNVFQASWLRIGNGVTLLSPAAGATPALYEHTAPDAAQTPDANLWMYACLLTPTPTETFLPGVPTYTFTPTPTPNVNVIVTWQGRPTPPAAAWSATVRVVIDRSYATMTDTIGSAALTNVAAGTYSVSCKGTHTLRAVLTYVVGSGSLNCGVLFEGDANDDNFVTGADLNLLSAAYGSQLGSLQYDSQTDFNNDGFVAGADLSLLASNYGKTGQ